MLHHQDQPLNSAYRGQGGSHGGSSSSLQNRKCGKDGNFNFLPGKGDEGPGGADENRNQARPRSLSPRDSPTSAPSAGYLHTSGILSPRSRRPGWTTLEPLPEVEGGDDVYGRVPPDGAEEGRMEEEVRPVAASEHAEKQREQQRRSGLVLGGGEGEEDDDEWGDSDSDGSYRSGDSVSSLNMDSGGEGTLAGGWDRIGVGEPKADHQQSGATARSRNGDPPAGRRSVVRRHDLGNLPEEGAGERDDDGRSSDSDGELPELTDAVWTLRDRERFKAQEMEKHQAQLTMYRRLALIRWVRTLQSRIQEQQDRLQSSFDIILTQRKELLRMGAAAAAAAPAAAVSQS